MTQTNTGGEGNTKTSPLKKTVVKSRKWCLTVNNFSESDKDSIKNLTNCEWIFGEEVGTSGTPHLQCYFEFKNARTFSSMKKNFPTAHIEKAKGNSEQNVKYCCKDGKYEITDKLKKWIPKTSRKDRLLKKYDDVKWHPWQQDIIDIVQEKPDERTINWIVDTTGNKGKSFLAKYLVMKYNAIICSGKTNDVANQVNIWLEANPDEDPTLVIMDVPRSSLGYINYTVLEQLKNGMMYSGKYEGGVCLFDHPHVFVFANEEPNLESMSLDRWNVAHVA